MTFWIVFLVATIRITLNYALEENLTYILFTFAVVLCSWYGGLGSGIFATILCIFFGVFYSPEPESEIMLSNTEERLRVLLFVAQGTFISLISESMQSATRWQAIILESISDVFITYDRNMRFMYMNRRAEEMFGLSREETLGKRFVDVYKNAKKSILYKNCRESFKTQRTKEFEIRLPGEDKWFYVSLYPSPDGVSAYYRDITRRKKTERRLRQSQLQFKRFTNANIIGVVVEDINGRVYEANDMFLQMIGYTREELQAGKVNWRELTPPEYQKHDEEKIKRILKKGMSQPYIKEYIRKDKKRISVMVGAVLLNKATGRIIAFYLDITEQQALDKKKNEFISIASHELKTPLTSVKAFTQILMRQFNNTDDTRTLYFLTNINSQLNKLDELINDLLDVSKIEEGRLNMKMKPFKIDDLIEKVVVDFQYITQSHTLIKKGSTSKMVFGDEDRIGQVLSNLLSNAIKYSPNADRVHINVRSRSSFVEIAVQDFGEGVPQADKESIFTRFFRSRKHEGSRISGFGLGLYITRAIVANHKGEIHVESTEGKGSTFTVRLPVIKEKDKEK